MKMLGEEIMINVSLTTVGIAPDDITIPYFYDNLVTGILK